MNEIGISVAIGAIDEQNHLRKLTNLIELFIVFSKTEAHKSFGTLHNIIFYRVVELLFNTDEDLIRCMNSPAQLIVITITTLSIFLLTISMLDGIASFQVQKDDIQILYPLKVAYVFAAEGEQLRCTDGKLASSQDQCPATDRCPPAQNNTVSNCVSEASSNSTLASSDIQNTTNETLIPPPCLDNRFTLHTPQCTDSSSSSENDTSTSSSENDTSTN